MSRKLTTAEEKANNAVKNANAKINKDKKIYNTARRNYSKYKQSNKKSLAKKWEKKKNSSKRKLDRDTKALAKAEAKAKQVQKDVTGTENLNEISSKIDRHNSNLENLEGHAAIYLSDGSSTEIIYIAPTETESEDTASNISTWARDKGAPAYDYARVASKTITVSGIITGKTRADADAKFYKLRVWHSRHYLVTYKGNIYYKHLLISDIQKSHKDKIDNLDVSITFTFAYAAQITTENDSQTQKKTSKSSKTTAGNRTKKYTALTIKSGDTLWGLSQKYGKPVSWLQKVNHIKGTTIYAGKKIRVR